MQIIEKNLKEKNQTVENGHGVNRHVSVLEKKSANLQQPEMQTSLSKNLAKELMGLIIKVNEGGVTPDTVNASCNAASQIHKILRLNYDMKKEGF